MWELIQSTILEIITTLLTGLVAYIATRFKKKYEEHINALEKQKIVKTVVNAIEQLYKDLDGPTRKEKAKENIILMLREKGIVITELEMDMMIEAVVNGFNQGLQKDGDFIESL